VGFNCIGCRWYIVVVILLVVVVVVAVQIMAGRAVKNNVICCKTRCDCCAPAPCWLAATHQTTIPVLGSPMQQVPGELVARLLPALVRVRGRLLVDRTTKSIKYPRESATNASRMFVSIECRELQPRALQVLSSRSVVNKPIGDERLEYIVVVALFNAQANHTCSCTTSPGWPWCCSMCWWFQVINSCRHSIAIRSIAAS
jgi:hypothetical protein